MEAGRGDGERLPATRASDADREATAVLLREAFGEGRLTLEELTERLEWTYAATTGGELERVSADLPGRAELELELAELPATNWIVAVMGGSDRRGRWRLARRTKVVAVMGGCDLDLSGAELSGGEAEITAVAVMGGIDVIVPPGVEVELDGFALLGGNDDRTEPAPERPGTPRVKVRAFSLMGGVDVKTKRPQQPLRERLGLGGG